MSKQPTKRKFFRLKRHRTWRERLLSWPWTPWRSHEVIKFEHDLHAPSGKPASTRDEIALNMARLHNDLI